MVTLTLHALKRFNERMGISSERKAQNNAERAWKKGKTVNDFIGKARNHLLRIENKRENTVIRIFANYCFIFKNDGVLLTEYKMPSWILNSNSRKSHCFGDEDESFISECVHIVYNVTYLVLDLFLEA